jgi:hypothetical protein
MAVAKQTRLLVLKPVIAVWPDVVTVCVLSSLLLPTVTPGPVTYH